ncbi:MAG: DUF4407 domain-containing protein [Muribaculaceae bacterium]|nr:DUF4407 domain-containing protein [Muribaculaceae bacterium]
MSKTNPTSIAREISTVRPGRINEFLWSCAGVNKGVLRQCPSDYSKYAGIGGMILFTAIMAAISGGYALYFVFNSYAIAGLFGLFWGLLIFNLDRFIVNTMYSDGKYTISWAEIRSGLPRIIMAIFLGLVISTPLEMKIFSDQIDSQLLQDNGKRIKQAKLAYKGLYDELDRYEEQKHDIEIEEATLHKRLLDAQEDLRKEAEGSALSGKIGHGPIYADKERFVNECQAAYDRYKATKSPDISRLNSEINRVKKDILRHEGQIDKDATQNGFAVRYEAFENVTSWQNHPTLALVTLMITLLFVIIETAPTFLRMMMEDGPYDDLLRAQKYKTKVLADKCISDVNDAVNTCVRISTMKNEKRLEAETIANEEIMAQIARAQAELLETAIAGWKEIELEKIRQNPSAYVVSIAPPQQEIQVATDEEGNLSEFSTSDVDSMATSPTSIIEDTVANTSNMPAEDIIDNANNTSESENTKELANSESTASHAMDITENSREQA